MLASKVTIGDREPTPQYHLLEIGLQQMFVSFHQRADEIIALHACFLQQGGNKRESTFSQRRSPFSEHRCRRRACVRKR